MNQKLRMPAEWEAHDAIWLSWPQNLETWFDKLPSVENIYLEIIEAISPHEKVNLCVNNQKIKNDVLEKVSKRKIDLNQVSIHQFPTNDAWIRDYGPIFVKDEDHQTIITNWEFNMWGGKYPPWDDDNQIPVRVEKEFQLKSISTNMILEGGSIEVNGQGALITTKSCLLNKNRNPHLSQTEIENNLKKYLGIDHFIWLESGILGDDTDGHIDDITRFVNDNTIITMIEENKNLDHHEVLDRNFQTLKKAKNNQGQPFEIIPLPMPDPVLFQNEVMPASYANFYIGNDTVLLPVFNCPQDKIAMDTLKSLFPDRIIHPILASDLVVGLGGIHCISCQQPK